MLIVLAARAYEKNTNVFVTSESDFYELDPRLKSTINRFQLSAGLNLKTLNTILRGNDLIWTAA